MARPQQTRDTAQARGILACPLEALVFLLPLIVLYEVVSRAGGQRVIANDLIQLFFDLFGRLGGGWAPPLTVVVMLLATQLASRQRWRVRVSRVLLMYAEAAVLAVPLIVLSRRLPLGSVLHAASLQDVALSVGAGVYEELVFRLVFITVVMMIGTDVLHLPRGWVTVAAIVLSSIVFAAHHHPPLGSDPFTAGKFAFRTLAGAYLAVVFWFRGYGPAAGCHAAYNIGIGWLSV
ncbi:MAG: CPBP family intramembrane glutamic endopeptidase [Phycisphaerae bacterium]